MSAENVAVDIAMLEANRYGYHLMGVSAAKHPCASPDMHAGDDRSMSLPDYL